MFLYSFKDTAGAISNPAFGQFQFSGQIGAGEFIVSMATERTTMETMADGAIVGSSIAGRSGTVEIQVAQTSDLHRWLLNLFNLLEAAQNAGSVVNWFGTSLTLINQVDGSQHICTGGAFPKIPDKTYAAQAGRVMWRIMFADIANSAPMPA